MREGTFRSIGKTVFEYFTLPNTFIVQEADVSLDPRVARLGSECDNVDSKGSDSRLLIMEWTLI